MPVRQGPRVASGPVPITSAPEQRGSRSYDRRHVSLSNLRFPTSQPIERQRHTSESYHRTTARESDELPAFDVSPLKAARQAARQAQLEPTASKPSKRTHEETLVDLGAPALDTIPEHRHKRPRASATDLIEDIGVFKPTAVPEGADASTTKDARRLLASPTSPAKRALSSAIFDTTLAGQLPAWSYMGPTHTDALPTKSEPGSQASAVAAPSASKTFSLASPSKVPKATVRAMFAGSTSTPVHSASSSLQALVHITEATPTHVSTAGPPTRPNLDPRTTDPLPLLSTLVRPVMPMRLESAPTILSPAAGKQRMPGPAMRPLSPRKPTLTDDVQLQQESSLSPVAFPSNSSDTARTSASHLSATSVMSSDRPIDARMSVESRQSASPPKPSLSTVGKLLQSPNRFLFPSSPSKRAQSLSLPVSPSRSKPIFSFASPSKSPRAIYKDESTPKRSPDKRSASTPGRTFSRTAMNDSTAANLSHLQKMLNRLQAPRARSASAELATPATVAVPLCQSAPALPTVSSSTTASLVASTDRRSRLPRYVDRQVPTKPPHIVAPRRTEDASIGLGRPPRAGPSSSRTSSAAILIRGTSHASLPEQRALASTSGVEPRSVSSPGALETKPANAMSTVLEDVVAFVDVRTAEGDDASQLFIEMLREMGAKVYLRPSNAPITHIIYKSGRPTTYHFYKSCIEPKPFIVGTSWILQCHAAVERVSETPFLLELEPEAALLPRVCD
ncbi:uncharacterized protein L969DRAFT_164460 [Mixia osmundae IAM 14324]|uniref:uncharacterized protein n=1 Tax=Mixia osmundae (strain CBS 9802 / IAM 14324 / JCM 22182 / KY 12970) TaxID=764103 RepID=UPI0004A54806|nr:uncharacterized protein L969DRAFT_164460 [Mixia osmundae IAM 14324]KEI42652.1 hypothetical protein L969DRAFT_164460 [Mixia osmundae IAM 14324]